MTDTTSASNGATVKPDNQYHTRGYASGRSEGKNSFGQQYNIPSQTQNAANLAFLSQGVAAMKFQDGSYIAGGRGAPSNTPLGHFNGYALPNTMGAQYWSANNHLALGAHQAYNSGTPHSAPIYASNGPYIGYSHNRLHDNSPMSHGWTSGLSSQMSADMPSLITPRRESMSSGGNDSPGTPSHPPYPGGYNGVTIVNRSPGAFNTANGSPYHMTFPSGMHMAKVPDTDDIAPHLRILVTKNPAIPSAIPAPSSPLKALDRALENPRGETNVYIRGLMPETTDAMLEEWGRRFGDIKSSKSIIDHTTGSCKGFGFVRFHNYKDAENCIRGFHHLGYEVSFARESFYSKLKAIADDANTNLYVSNLPKSMNEHELANIFSPHKVCSARILRNTNGTGRGVGFARFESRVACEEIIQDFNNRVIEYNDEEYTIQIRYADTQEQKHLKQTTAAARQFRSAEYEYATQAHRQGAWRVPSSTGSPEVVTPNNDYEGYMPHNETLVSKMHTEAPRAIVGPIQIQRTPLSVVSSSTSNIRRNASVNSTPLAKVPNVESNEGGGVSTLGENATPTVPANGENAR